jgi:hypothetical protein
MPSAIIYNSSTGEIVSFYEGSEQDIIANANDGLSYLISTEDTTNKYVVNGVLVDLPADVIEEKDLERSWHNLRKTRWQLLVSSDWTQVSDAPVDAAAWAVYRQQLRDLPANTTDPRNVVWPEPPS